jgi:hypothetical protein
MRTRSLLLCSLLMAAIAAGLVGSAGADSTPIGPLPKGPVTRVESNRGSLVAVALPRQTAGSGLVWRVARRVDSRILRQRDEADVGSSVVLVFRAVGRGTATVRFGLTKGDSSSRAVKSATYVVEIK